MSLIMVYVNGETVLMPEESLYIPPFDFAQDGNKNAPDGLRGAANHGASESISKSVEVSSVEVSGKGV
jgi:hypothetical protein